MRSRYLVCGLVVVALGFCGVASADMVVYDDFSGGSNGTTLDTTKWGTYQSGNWATVGGGNLTITGKTGTVARPTAGPSWEATTLSTLP